MKFKISSPKPIKSIKRHIRGFRGPGPGQAWARAQVPGPQSCVFVKDLMSSALGLILSIFSKVTRGIPPGGTPFSVWRNRVNKKHALTKLVNLDLNKYNEFMLISVPLMICCNLLIMFLSVS